jgi:hypothetical protein
MKGAKSGTAGIIGQSFKESISRERERRAPTFAYLFDLKTSKPTIAFEKSGNAVHVPLRRFRPAQQLLDPVMVQQTARVQAFEESQHQLSGHSSDLGGAGKAGRLSAL